jgi:hypothetical protein
MRGCRCAICGLFWLAMRRRLREQFFQLVIWAFVWPSFILDIKFLSSKQKPSQNQSVPAKNDKASGAFPV